MRPLPRWLIALIGSCYLVLLTTTSTVQAAPFPDVPSDHWAYEAVTYLQEKGLVEGYPDGYFKGNRVLTRYEFAIVIARLYDTLLEQYGAGAMPADEAAIYSRLEEAFSTDLMELRDLVAQNDARITDIESSFGELSQRTDQTEKDLKSLLGQIGNVKLTGDVRLRAEFLDRSAGNPDTTRVAKLRLRVKGTADITDDVTGVFQIATGGEGSTVATNENLEDFFQQDPFDLDWAYLNYHPDGWNLTAGRFPPTWEHTMLTFDADVAVEGLGQQFFTADPHWVLNLAQLQPANAGYYLVNQLGYEDLGLENLDFYATWHVMHHDTFYLLRSAGDDPMVPIGNRFSSDVAMDSDFSQIDLLARYDFSKLIGMDDYPLVLTGNYVDADYDVAPGGEERWTKATLIQLQGGKLRNPGDWNWNINTARLQPNSVISAWPDGDRGGANREYWSAGLGYLWQQNVNFMLTYVDSDSYIGQSPASYTKIMLDANAKF